MKKILLLLFTALLLVGCNVEKDAENNSDKLTISDFNFEKNFEIITFKQEDNNIYLTIKSDDNVKKYLKKLHEKYNDRLFTFHITMFTRDAENTVFDSNDLKGFRCTVEYESTSNSYSLHEYIELPAISESSGLTEFKNEEIREEKDGTHIVITFYHLEKIEDIISEAKTYIELVKDLNKTNNHIFLEINGEYIYEENTDYVIRKTDCQL